MTLPALLNNLKFMKILSPVTKTDHVVKVNDYSVESIVSLYKKDFSLDVSDYFKGLDSISVYQCLDTGYRFFYPLNLSGDEFFYQHLQKYDWYYSNWKWEYDDALSILEPEKKLLEVGCGDGYFLLKARDRGVVAEGIELNNSAVKACRAKGLQLHNESVIDYAVSHNSAYDYVFSFQVVEHIAEVGLFIKAMVDLLKPGGRLLISVPNNDSALFKESGLVALNMPPHHMGLWDLNSLVALADHYPITLEKIWLEGLDSRHAGIAETLAEKMLALKLAERSKIFGPILHKLVARFARFGGRSVSKYILGHTITVVYRKYE